MRTAEPDREDRFELPSALRKLIIPRERLPSGRRAQDPNPAARKLNPAALKQELTARLTSLRLAQPAFDAAIADPASDPTLVALLRDEDLTDLQSLSPAGAAIAASFSGRSPADASPAHASATDPSAAKTIDIWVHSRGLPFAVAAFCVYVRFNGQAHDNRHLRPIARPLLDDHNRTAMLRLLEHVRAASDDDYAAAMAAAEDARKRAATTDLPRVVALFLFPDRHDWRAEDLPAFRRHVAATDYSMVLSVIGADATTDLISLFDRYDETNRDYNGTIHPTQDLEQILRLVSWLPTDEALQALIDRSAHKLAGPILVAAARRFPRRAVRLLAEAEPAKTTKTVTEILRIQVLSDPELATTLLPDLSAAARGRVEAVLAARPNHPVATPEQLPPVLVTPPWLNRRDIPKPVTIDGLTPRSQNRVVWLPGEREQWTARNDGFVPAEGWQSVADALAQHRLTSSWQGQYFVCYAPDHLVRPLLGTWHPKFHHAALLQGFAARYELLALPTVRDRMPAEQSRLLQPFTGPEIATFMADCLNRPGLARMNARTWFGRHAEDAVRDLTPAAVGKPGVRRRAAEEALRLIAASGAADAAHLADTADVAACAHLAASSDLAAAAAGASIASITSITSIAADEYGAEAGAAVAALLADDGLHRLPRVMPTLPAWAEPATLPPIVLADRSAVLPEAAVRAITQMFAISRLDAPYPGLAQVTAACDRASLAAFAWNLFRGWELAGASSKERWAYEALAAFGDDDTVRRLVPLIRAWPKENYIKRAFDGVDILAAMGSNAALSALSELALKGKPPRLRKYAESRITLAAENLGLTADQLADRTVPDLGLAADGSLRLDYGPRQFVIGFDEQLKPFVTDQAGKRLKTLPKPGVKDDPIPAQAAYEQFSALKKAARALASEQIGRLERAMCRRRSWSSEEFEELLLGHPLLRHVVRRLVWTVFDAAPQNGGSAVASFRVAEDLSLADAEDETYRLPEGPAVAIAIAHPVDLGDEAHTWSDVFGDYEILQPFPQLGRPVFELFDAERAATILTRFSGRPASPFGIVGLERRGWLRGRVEDGAVWHDVIRPLGKDWELVASFSPGIAAWGIEGSGAQDISKVWIRTTGSPHQSAGDSGIAFSVLDPVVASEILRDLTEVTAQATDSR